MLAIVQNNLNSLIMNTRNLIISALIEYDKKQSKKKFYNRNALGIYMRAMQEEVDPALENNDWKIALEEGFNGALLNFVIKFVEKKLK